MEGTSGTPRPRIRKVDWRRAITELDASTPGTAVYVGVLDQSVRTHINTGRYGYIDPSKYRAYTKGVQGSRTQAHLYLYRTADESTFGVGMGKHPE